MLSDHWFNPDIDVRKSGEGGRRGSRSRRRRRRGGGVGIPIPLLSFICSVVNNGFQALANSPLASNFLLLSSLNGFLAKSFFKSESVDPLCFSTSILRALRVDVAPPLLIDEVVSVSFSLFLLNPSPDYHSSTFGWDQKNQLLPLPNSLWLLGYSGCDTPIPLLALVTQNRGWGIRSRKAQLKLRDYGFYFFR